MKKPLFIVAFLMLQIFSAQNKVEHGSGNFEFNPEKKSCLTDLQKQKIWTDIKVSQEKLITADMLSFSKKADPHPKFIWPMRKAANTPYENVWSISAHVDHDPLYPNKVKDWNCGTRTYDTADGYNHQGIDIYLWPFPAYQQANNQAEVIAAADGVIVYKNDGNYDQNCSMSGGDWNAVYIQHSDGSIAWYGHLKNNSLTSKMIGATVTAGEYLGIVGSSGNSTGPHLHFEVYNKYNQLIETYQGSCNNFASGTDSWWIDQKPYVDPKINAVLTHSGIPDFNTICPNIETTLIKNTFSRGETVYGILYLADQKPSTSFTMKLIRPDNSIAINDYANIDVFQTSSYWWWAFTPSNFNMNGEWKLEINYSGKTVTHKFVYEINFRTIDEELEQNIKIYPNPTNSLITIVNLNNKSIKKISLWDLSGKLIKNISNVDQNKIDVTSIPKGTYILSVTTDKQTYNIKFIKK